MMSVSTTVAAKNPPKIRDLKAERPFEGTGSWKLWRSSQTERFLPNRVVVDRDAGIVVLLSMKSRTGTDYGVSAEALEVLPKHEAGSSWVQQAYVMLCEGEMDRPDEIVVTALMTANEAAERVRGKTPNSGRGSRGDYFWLRPPRDEDEAF